MTKKLILSLTLALVVAANSAAVEGVNFELQVRQAGDGSGSTLLLRDTLTVLTGISATGFFINTSIDLDVTAIDSSYVSFLLHTVTFDPKPDTRSGQFRAELGVPVRVDDLRGKNDSRIQLLLTPLEKIAVDTAGCGYQHQVKGVFKKDPAAWFDIHFVPQTLADFHWNTIKGVLDERYREFRDMNSFNLPGKYEIYLAPCAMPSVLWDDRFGTMVDPTRSSAYAIYNHDINTADPFLLLHASVFKNYGYAPPFLAEGFAGYLSLGVFDMKRLLEEQPGMAIDSLFDTYTFLSADPLLADRVASTFCKYLINQYHSSEFLKVYKQADDLNLRETIESVYGKSLSELQAEWRVYVDTVTVNLTNLAYHTEIAETMMHYGLMGKYAEAMLHDYADSRNDSLQALPYAVRAEFLTGDYYGATDYQQQLVKTDSASARNLVSLAAYKMMNGEYDSALTDLQAARAIDSTDLLLKFNLALNTLFRGQRDSAAMLFDHIINAAEPTEAQIESRMFLTQMLVQRGQPDDLDRVKRLSYEVINALAPQIRGGDATPYAYLWSGIAYLAVGDMPTAWEYLQVAEFLEVRPFYLGMVNLWLGKISDMRGEHQVAREYYGRVLGTASADYHQKEARFLLDNPFEMNN